jgi:hypothetical protein
MKTKRYSMGRIDDLTESQFKVLRHLMTWNYEYKKANFFNIAMLSGVASSTVALCLRHLKERGIARSSGGSWYVQEKIKPLLFEEKTEVKQNGQVGEDKI